MAITPLRNPPNFKGPPGQEDMPWLLTPGPVTTSRAVKFTMLADWGSRDAEFQTIVADIRKRLLKLAGTSPEHECVIMQGPGTFAIEAALGSFCPARTTKTLVVSNGAYGQRAARILQRIVRPVEVLDVSEASAPSVKQVAELLDKDQAISHVWLVHCETTSGIVNPVHDIAQAVKERKRTFMVDAMSSFGALPLNLEASGIDVMVSSSSKCIEGVPGFAYVIAKRGPLIASRGRCHSFALDLHDQWKALEETGQFRFTPPTHALAAFQQALKELEKEGGVLMRGARYARNAEVLVKGMRDIGFSTLLSDRDAGPIIQTFLRPQDPNFDFGRFHENLRAHGFSIYPGKLTKQPSFRIGTIGQLDEEVIKRMLQAIREVLREMNVTDLGTAASVPPAPMDVLAKSAPPAAAAPADNP